MIHKRSLFLLALLLAPAAVPAQPAFQVADLNTTQPRASSGFGLMLPLATVGTKIFFQGDDGIHGVELWWVDSATGATAMVKDICPGECPSGASDVTLSNGILYFWAYEGVHGYEPWRSDGTVAGTFLLQDVYPGGLFSIVSGTPFVDVDGTLFFAADDGVHGAELWKVNASGTGAELVADIVPGPERSTPHPWLSKDGELIFTANDGAHGRELWKSDGTAAGTQMIRDLHPGDLSSVPDPFSIVRFHYALPDGTFVFGADDGVHGSELWRSDGTDAGTVLVEDIASGADSSSPFNFVPMNGTIVFAASTPSLGREIWGTNGTEAGTSLFIDATPGPSDSSPRDLTVAGNQIFFFSGLGASNIGRPLYRADASQGKVLIASEVRVASSLGSSLLFLTGAVGIGQPLQLWKTEGTPAGNVLLKDFGAQVQFCFQNIDPRALSGAVYFHTCPSDTGQAFWKSDGTPGGTLPVHQSAQTPSFTQYAGLLGRLGGDLIFSATDGGAELELFRTDGTSGGTVPLSGNAPTASMVFGFSPWAQLENLLLFRSGSFVGDVWKTDGTGAGTEQIIPSGAGNGAVLGSAVLFSRFVPDSGTELWKTDGTAAGTVLVKDIQPGADSSNPFILGTLGPWVLFRAVGTPGSLYGELWRTDGTEAGTVQISTSAVNAANLVVLDGGTALFTAGDLFSGEIWRTDGTTAGTVFVKDVITANPFYVPLWNMVSARNRAFFTLDDGVHGLEVWVSDGTEAGTHIVKDIVPGLGHSDPRELVAVRNRAFFVANDVVHGLELWTSDGTEAGTRMVKDIVPGPGSLRVSSLASMGHALVFAAADAEHGYEPWVSNGTEAGTRRLQDIAPGPLPSSPGGFFRAFPNAYFVANDGTAGFELWSVPRTALGGSFGDVPTSHWAWRQIETLAENGITNGCGTGADYCPASFLTRAEMAIFLGRALHGASFVPPAATGTRFQDVPANFWAASWIEQIATDGVTQGCSASPPLFCPGSSVTRAEMAIFLLRALHGGSYAPPPPTGTRFTDVPANHWASAWIEQLAAEGITSGCAPGLYCPGGLVNRAEMAVFLTRAFGLGEP